MKNFIITAAISALAIAGSAEAEPSSVTDCLRDTIALFDRNVKARDFLRRKYPTQYSSLLRAYAELKDFRSIGGGAYCDYTNPNSTMCYEYKKACQQTNESWSELFSVARTK